MSGKKANYQFINIGSASIVMIFAVLCLTIFCALTLLSANSEAKISEKYAASVKAYYDADYKAAVMKEAFDDEVKKKGQGGDISYQVKIDENRSLSVELFGEKAPLSILSWKQIETGNWEVKEDISVWDGELQDFD